MGLPCPAGSCPTVGVAGLTLGGGVGVLGRAYGLTCDNLEAVQVVTADGSILDADASQHGDLYWACRGGGGGNFGVATSIDLPHPPARPAGPVLPVLALAAGGAGGGRLAVVGTARAGCALVEPAPVRRPRRSRAHGAGGWHLPGRHRGPGGAARPAVRPGGVGAAEPVRPRRPRSWTACWWTRAAPASPWTSATCRGRRPAAGWRRVPSDAKSDFFTAALPRAGIRTLLTGVERLRGVRGASGGAGGIAFDAFGGALNRVPAAATAFVHRDTLFLAQYTTEWPDGAAVRAVVGQRAWLRRLRPGAGVPVPAGGRPRP